MWARYGLPDTHMANMLGFEFHLSLETEFLALHLWGESTPFYKSEVNQRGNIQIQYVLRGSFRFLLLTKAWTLKPNSVVKNG